MSPRMLLANGAAKVPLGGDDGGKCIEATTNTMLFPPTRTAVISITQFSVGCDA